MTVNSVREEEFMSGSATFENMGDLNSGWGICGFTSTFYAMHQANPAARGWLMNATQVYSVLYEIVDYLKALQGAAQGTTLLKDITNFTQSFGPPYDGFSVPAYINKVETSSEQTRQYLVFGTNPTLKSHEKVLKNDDLFGIAMPPAGVADYIQRMWKWNATVTAADVTSDAIVGVRKKNSTMKLYNGLCHYLYRGGGKYYSWGKVYSSLADANNAFEICYAITISKP
jgi:hypothetical protein